MLVEGDVAGLYYAFLDRQWDGVRVEGDRELLERLFDGVREPAAPVASGA